MSCSCYSDPTDSAIIGEGLEPHCGFWSADTQHKAASVASAAASVDSSINITSITLSFLRELSGIRRSPASACLGQRARRAAGFQGLSFGESLTEISWIINEYFVVCLSGFRRQHQSQRRGPDLAAQAHSDALHQDPTLRLGDGHCSALRDLWLQDFWCVYASLSYAIELNYIFQTWGKKSPKVRCLHLWRGQRPSLHISRMTNNSSEEHLRGFFMLKCKCEHKCKIILLGQDTPSDMVSL